MRLDANTKEGQDFIEANRPIRVYIDARELPSNLITVADEEAGYVEMGVMDAEGHVLLIRKDGGSFCTVRIEGVVNIQVKGEKLPHEHYARLWQVHTIKDGTKHWGDGKLYEGD